MVLSTLHKRHCKSVTNMYSAFVDHGKVLAQGTREEVLTKENILTAFQLEPVIHENASNNSYYIFFE